MQQSVHFPPMNNDFHDIVSPQSISPDPIPVPLFDNPPKDNLTSISMDDPVETTIPTHIPIPKPVFRHGNHLGLPSVLLWIRFVKAVQRGGVSIK